MANCGDHTTNSTHGAEAHVEARAFPIPDEIKQLGLGSYDDAIKQIVNISLVVAIVYAVLAGVQYAMPDILTDFMANKLRTAMLAAVVLPILLQQIRKAVTDGVDTKVGRNVAVAAVLAYVLLFHSGNDLLGKRLFDSPRDMVGMGSSSGMMGPRRLRPAMPTQMPAMPAPVGSNSSMYY